MAILDEDGLSRVLKAPLKAHIFLLFGDDAYLKEVYLDRLIKAALPDDSLRFFNYHAYEDDDTPLDEILGDADTLPMMAEHTCLVAKNYPLCDLSDKALKELEEKLRDMPETTVLVFCDTKVNFTNNRREFPKWASDIGVIARVGHAVELSHRSLQKTARMLIRGAAQRGTGIGEEEARYMVETCGDDLGNLLNEFNKLCAYADGRPITAEMIDEVVTKSVEASVFDLSEMIFTGNADRAFAIVYELLRRKTPMHPILGALYQAYMTLYRYKTAAAAGKPIESLLADMGYKPEQAFQFRKAAACAAKVPMAKLRRSLDILIEADIKSKSTSIEANVLLTELIAKLCAV